jgi:hypothetical protein
MRDSTNKNPLETSLKSSQNFKSSKHRKRNSLIKEDSNEEKSSSNSNSNNELVTIAEIKPLEKSHIFSQKLSLILSSCNKHRR